MKKMENTNVTNKYVESKSIRNITLDSVDYDFLDKIKVIPYLTKDMVLTIGQVANYYEVTTEAVKTVVKRNREEFESDGMVVLKGEELKRFKEEVSEVQSEPYFKQAKSITLLQKRSLLRAGMILTNSGIATKVNINGLHIRTIRTWCTA